jgi:hypothetical protein
MIGGLMQAAEIFLFIGQSRRMTETSKDTATLDAMILAA